MGGCSWFMLDFSRCLFVSHVKQSLLLLALASILAGTVQRIFITISISGYAISLLLATADACLY